jgi:hypothetical protein
MIERRKGLIVITCDSCDATIEGHEDDGFQALWATAKEEGWRSSRIKSLRSKQAEWVHGCPDCGA